MQKNSTPKPDYTSSVTIQFKTFITENTASSTRVRTEHTPRCNSLHQGFITALCGVKKKKKKKNSTATNLQNIGISLIKEERGTL